MIHIYIRGRLGNQLFQYAFIRSLQEQVPSAEIAYHFDEVYAHGKTEDGWENSLKFFNVKNVHESSISPHYSIVQRMALRLYWLNFPHHDSIDIRNKYQLKWVKLLSKIGLYYLDTGYYPFPAPKTKNVVVSGNFECENYFHKIRDKLLDEIRPIYPIRPQNIELLEKIYNTNSICISIRRGDYITNNSYKKLHYICTPQYYNQAIKRIIKNVDNPTFFFFSDDIEWVKKNIKPPVNSYYESGGDPIWEKLRLMYSCKHFIISNSTFSWWAQYLGQFSDKIVVAPSKWFNSPLKSSLYMDNWQLIEID